MEKTEIHVELESSFIDRIKKFFNLKSDIGVFKGIICIC